MSGRCTCYKNKETKKQTKSGKKKQKKNELPLHAYSDIAQYVPLQLYLITIIYHNYHNYTELLIIVKIKSKKKELKADFFLLRCYHTTIRIDY